jgi:hypothetical protein
MPAFDAGSVVDPLDWNFTGKRPDGTPTPNWPKALASARGTIIEPSDKQIAQFLEGLKSVYKDAQQASIQAAGVDSGDPAAVLEALDSLGSEEVLRITSQLSQLYADLCSGEPSVEQLNMLPLRVRVHFFAWLRDEVVYPEAGPAAGIAQVRTLQRAAGG